MIEIRFEERVKIGLQYVLESLHGCSPFGQEKIRRLRFYMPEERAELETELYNVERAAAAADRLKDQYTKLMTGLCQMKDIRIPAPLRGGRDAGPRGAVRNQGLPPASGRPAAAVGGDRRRYSF